ncbi:DinB family protein [Actinopolymorpha singaporensis]|uniref:DinB family protein n=1 Tax=Actinopolymorpha singaporensis TaxID=117157 RepID=A0A1H1RR18_9ACTN|nr:DinB family protein [Actinopolymorpha singaporensis]SDS38168.1 Protein of unknown function [Actinopolymorpha singaporensis]
MTTDRTDVPATFDERSTLLTMLDYTRKTAIAKCEGLSDADAARAPLPTSPMMTVSGLISHLRWVEYSWIQVRLLGHEDEGPWTEEDPDREFHYRLTMPLAEVIADYEQLAREHDTQIAGWDLDMVAAHPLRDGREINLRWILHHLVEENARHNGHIDIIREIVDGTTGD